MAKPVNPMSTITHLVIACAVLLSVPVSAQVDTGTVQGTVRDASGRRGAGRQRHPDQRRYGRVVPDQDERRRQLSVSLGPDRQLHSGRRSRGICARHARRFIAQHSAAVRRRLRAEAQQYRRDRQRHGQAVPLQTQEASLGGVVQSKTINELPLNGRNYTFLAQLNPGVVQAQQDTRGMGGNGSFSANGQNSFANNYLLDGVDNNSNLVDFVNGAGYVYRPSVDALQEFRVQTSSYSAELGRSAGAVLNASLKSGGDQYRGNVFEFHRNSAMDAINFFDEFQGLKKGKFIRNQFGFTLGGPMRFLTRGNKKTFFFVDYEGTVARQATTSILTAPTPRMQDSNFTDMSDLIRLQGGTRTDRLGRAFPLGTIFDPATTRLIAAGAVDPMTGGTVTEPGRGVDSRSARPERRQPDSRQSHESERAATCCRNFPTRPGPTCWPATTPSTRSRRTTIIKVT